MDKNLKDILDEDWKTFKKVEVLKLPCGHESIPVKQGNDTYIECGECKKKFMLSWQKYSKPKLYGEK